ncbi:MAG: GntR family transcriptional regulator [Pseudohongiellaceae bacterium]
MAIQLESHAEATTIQEGLTHADRAFQTLQSDITKGEIKPGTKISEAGLASQYGISRGPLREALQRLESRGLLERIPHVGMRVVSLNLNELLEIYQVREALEGLACRLAAENMTDAEIAFLAELLEKHAADTEVQAGHAYFQKEGDFDFHYQIVKGAKNEHLAKQILSELYHLLRMYRYQCSLSEGRPQKALKEHLAILDAIADRDGDLAEMLMRKHIRQARQNIASQYKQQDFDLINQPVKKPQRSKP